MIDIDSIDKIYLYPGSTDLRKGMNSLGYLTDELLPWKLKKKYNLRLN